MPVWAWVLIIVLLVLLLTGGVYVRRSARANTSLTPGGRLA